MNRIGRKPTHTAVPSSPPCSNRIGKRPPAPVHSTRRKPARPSWSHAVARWRRVQGSAARVRLFPNERMDLVTNPPTPCRFGKHPPAPGGAGGGVKTAAGQNEGRAAWRAARGAAGGLRERVVPRAGGGAREKEEEQFNFWKTRPRRAIWQAPARTQKTKRKTRPAIRRSARWRVRWSAESHWVHSPVRACWPDINRTEQG